jgi:cell division protein FtsZ
MAFIVDLPKEKSSIIKVIGVGGGGGNAVNFMFTEGINGVDFIICNTDQQVLESSPIPNKIRIGDNLTEGRGAGSNPEVGKLAAEESLEEIIEALGVNTQMVFVTAGMGGGTGTGAAPVIAKAAKDLGILTVGIVTTPFIFEGSKRKLAAEKGIEELREQVDSLLIISNDRIKEMYGNLPISKAFQYADNVLSTAAKGIAEIITIAGSINVDFEDVKTAMKNSGVSILGNGLAEGQDRAKRAAELALNSPLLNDNKILGANDLLVNISYGAEEASMDEYALINEYLQGEAGMDANLKCGLCYDEALGNKISVTVIATGFNRKENKMKNFVLEETENKLDDNIFEEFHPEQHDVEANADDEAEVAKERRQTSIFDFIENPSEKPRVDSKNQELIDRISHLRRLKEKASQAEESDELDEPAYKRRGVALDEIPHSSEPGVSRFSLIDEPDKKPEIRANNSFLHDNVD